jgi:outer membrane protein insertion porin family
MYHKTTYELAQSKTTNASSTSTSTSGENGKALSRSVIGYRVGRDLRDNRFDPSEGGYKEISAAFAGVGGDVNFLRTNVSGGYYKPLLFKSVVLGVTGELGHINGLGEKVTQSQRFFLGGRSIRGFAANGIGPRDTGSDNAVGGNTRYSGTMEIVSSLGINQDTGIRWTVFSDFGSVWGTDYPSGVIKPDESSLRSSAGFGILWDTYIGPLSFYWAKPLSKMTHDDTKTFQFSIGTRL